MTIEQIVAEAKAITPEDHPGEFAGVVEYLIEMEHIPLDQITPQDVVAFICGPMPMVH